MERGEPVEVPEDRDSVEELPLEAMYRRESQVLTSYFQVVLGHLRLLQSESTVIHPTSSRHCAACPDLPPSLPGILG